LLNSKTFKIISAFIYIFVVLTSSNSLAIDDKGLKLKAGQPIVVNGDTVEYFEEAKKIVAEGNVSIEHGNVKLTCDRIEVDTLNKQALCEGNVRIEHPEGVLTGDIIRYDFVKEKGEIVGAEVKAFPWFGQADQTGKVAENEYLLKKGFVTTCDLDQPHYCIKAREIRVFPDDKIIAKNVVFYIGKVPVLWLPYYYHPIIQSRAKVQFIPGRSSDWGYFLLSAWRFYIRGDSRVDILADYRSKKGFAQGADFYYRTGDFGMDGLGEGLFRAYFVEENDKGTYDPTPFRDGESIDPELRKRFQWKHRIDFEPGTVGMLEFNKFSDEYFLKDYFYNEYEQMGTTPPNYASIISTKDNYTISIEANKRFNDFYTVTQRLPEVKLNVPNQQLWDTSFYYTTTTSATVFDKEFKPRTNGTVPDPQKVNRLDTFHQLSYAAKIGPLEVTPYGTFRETFYSRERESDDFTARMTLGGGVDVSTRFYRIFDVETDIFGLDINRLRHIVVPSAKYFHTVDPTVDKDLLYHMDSIDSIEKENGVTLSLENKLQTKRHAGDELKSADLVRFIVSTDYLFRLEKNSFDFKGNPKFDTINFDLEISPYSWLFIDSEWDVEPKNGAISAGSVEASLRPGDNFRMNVGYHYEKMIPKPRNQLTFDINYKLNPKWRIGWYERFDLQRMNIDEQQLSITRDLHCWEVELIYDVDGSRFFQDKFTLWVAFKIKAFPDLQLGLSRSFDKRRPGSSE